MKNIGYFTIRVDPDSTILPTLQNEFRDLFTDKGRRVPNNFAVWHSV